ncbi:Mce-associated membrane protein [Isoptericola jiangsuensis]|uniref:Mce-associated membrane protein n=1 Tax=Isoptericola jiangsuensis TaxID=548579 RepID=A0A2A9ESJ0_9MICO|nr:RDD family protein [Isoptericola jiangsuensis]PFG41526.1 Mce-associated membrane protein [Isoptericola jiangsuensis]
MTSTDGRGTVDTRPVWFATGASLGLATLPVWGESPDDVRPEHAVWWTGGTLLVLAVLQACTGMTPGKRAVGIAVVDARSHRPIGLAGTLLRWFAHFLDAILMLGYLRAAWHHEGRTWADSLLGTVVVRSTRPHPHPLVAWVRRVAPRLRWPSWITSTAALAGCALAAAACLVTGGGVDRTEPVPTSCRGDGPLAATTIVETTQTQPWESRLGVRRDGEPTTQVVAGWTTGLGLDDEAGPEAGPEVGPVVVSLELRSSDGYTLSSVADDRTGELTGDVPAGGDTYLMSTLPAQVGGTAAVEVPGDPAGWTARTVLADATDGRALAECTVPLPDPGPVLDPW